MLEQLSMFVSDEKPNKPKKLTTSKAALCKALLDGRTVSIWTGFQDFGISNIPREIGRSVERAFNVHVTRIPREGLTRYAQSVTWFDYKLEKSEINAEGRKKMYDYVYSMLK